MAVALLAVGSLAVLAQEPAPHEGNPREPQPVRIAQKLDQTVTIEADSWRADRRSGTAVYTGNVTVIYEVTRIRADKVTIYFASNEVEGPMLWSLWAAGFASPGSYVPSFEARDEMGLATKKGVAEGNVLLTDPDGTVRASRLEFNWELRTGNATDVEAEISGMFIKAASARVVPGRYELIDVSGTSCPDLYSLASRRVIVIPGDKVIIERPRFSLGPARLPALPTQTFSLDQRVVGLRFPGVSYKRGSGLGITWASGVLLDSQTALTGGFNIFPDQLPSYGVEIARSSVPPTRASGLISPRSELAERFNYGYFENISVRSPENEHGYLSSARDTVSVGSYWNQTALSPSGEARFSKALDIAYERGGSFGDLSGVGQVRAQHVREDRDPFRSRLVGSLALSPKTVEFAPGLHSHVRLNVQGFAGQEFFGWARLQVGATYRPLPQVTFGGVFNFAGEAGNPAFDVDRLYSTNSFHARGDLDLGPTKISVLGKYDMGQKRWYDHEYAISQVMGCLEGYVLWRQFPSDYRFGVRLRIDRFIAMLSSRELRRRRASASHKH